MNVHQRADSSQADGVPAASRTRAIRPWKIRNSTEREISISQGWETEACERAADSGPGWTVVVCMDYSFCHSLWIVDIQGYIARTLVGGQHDLIGARRQVLLP